jgi:hypothetical protein
VVKKSISAWMERGVVSKVNVSMDGKGCGQKVNFSMAKKGRSQLSPVWHIWKGAWSIKTGSARLKRVGLTGMDLHSCKVRILKRLGDSAGTNQGFVES